jgi:hypothetical protein
MSDPQNPVDPTRRSQRDNDPVFREPAAGEPAAPVFREPAAAEPAHREPVVSEPVRQEPVANELGRLRLCRRCRR